MSFFNRFLIAFVLGLAVFSILAIWGLRYMGF